MVAPAEASTSDVPAIGTGMPITDGLAPAVEANAEPLRASRNGDAGEGPAAKRAKHTDMAESEAANALPTPTPTPAEDQAIQTESVLFAPAAAEPSNAQGGSLWTSNHMPNTSHTHWSSACFVLDTVLILLAQQG